jgi:methionyl-tRNA formyltransferase
MKNNLNLIALGRSRYLYDSIIHLADLGYNFKAVITEKAYEEYDIKEDDFRNLAEKLGADFYISKSLNIPALLETIKKNEIQIAISANWQYKIPKSILDLFQYGIINFHLGNLPDYKGNATVNWTIINGEKFIYGNIHKMDPELDAGDVISRKAISISPVTYINDILVEAVKDAPILYEEAINNLHTDPASYVVKGSLKGLRCYPRLPEDSQINWNDSAENISRLVRASSDPYQGAFSFINGKKVVIWKAVEIFLEDKFLAIPGHIVQINKDEESIFVACQNGLLKVQEIGYDGAVLKPAQICKSIRERFKFSNDV